MKTKVCRKCKSEKSIVDFYKQKSHKDGLFSICKKCDKQLHGQWLNKNKKPCIDCGILVSYRSIRCYSCDNKNKYKSGLKKSWDGKFQGKITKEVLNDLYNTKGKNIIEIAKALGCKKSTIFDYLLKYNIKIIHNKGYYYKSIWMRSSWEVSYAKYLDKNNIKWLYEPKLFNLGRCKYKPDFYLTESNHYVEIKGRWYRGAKDKVNLFRKIYDIPLIVLEGNELRKMGVLK